MRILVLPLLAVSLLAMGCNGTSASNGVSSTTNGVTVSHATMMPGQQGNTYNGHPLGTTGSTLPPQSLVNSWNASNSSNSGGLKLNGVPVAASYSSSATKAISKAQGDTLNGVSTAKAAAQQAGVDINPLTNLLPKGWGGTANLSPGK